MCSHQGVAHDGVEVMALCRLSKMLSAKNDAAQELLGVGERQRAVQEVRVDGGPGVPRLRRAPWQLEGLAERQHAAQRVVSPEGSIVDAAAVSWQHSDKIKCRHRRRCSSGQNLSEMS